MSRRILFYTQHLLGIGHVVRALRIAEGLVAAGFDVTLVLGGVPVEGLGVAGSRIVQLPPLKAGPQGFTKLVTLSGAVPSQAYMDARLDLLLATLADQNPDVLLIEAFPFGRRTLRSELLPLISAARRRLPRVLIVSSVRDILQRDPRIEVRSETASLIEQAFDAVLVHGDPSFARLDATFPEVSRFSEKVHYTGFVAPGSMIAAVVKPADVIVTTGGGAVGFALIEVALQAKERTGLRDARWLAVTGPHMPEEQRKRLEALGAATGTRVELFVAGLSDLFGKAQVVVAQAGYNTVTELMMAQCHPVLVPFADSGETEQTERATRLAELGLAVALDPAHLNAMRLAAAIDTARALPALGITRFRLDGAARSAEIIAGLIRGRSA